MGKVIILVGPPGVGKSYWVKEYVKTHRVPYVICSADHFFEHDGKFTYDPSKIWLAHSTCFEKFQTAMNNDTPLIFIDNINATRKDRSKYINRAIENGYEVELQVFTRDPSIIKQQNKSQERVDAGKLVPDEYIDKVLPKFDIEPGLWKAEHDGNKSYGLKQALEAKQFIKKLIKEEHEDINKLDDKSLVTKEFHKSTEPKTTSKTNDTSFTAHCNNLMLDAIKLKEKISLLQTGITEKDKIEPLDDAYAAAELIVHHMEDLIQDT